jgi:hypothetical protein
MHRIVAAGGVEFDNSSSRTHGFDISSRRRRASIFLTRVSP